jgi:threonine dehydratase
VSASPPPLFSEAELRAALALVHAKMPPTPQYAWPTLCRELGLELWVKHENHTPTGAFKVRGGITFIDWLRRAHPTCRGIVTATRGNHGQSQARAATAAGLAATIVVPHGNAVEKNTAMRAFGARLVEHGEDFDAAREEAQRIAAREDLFLVPPFHREIVRGVATYALELFDAVAALDCVYVPIGCGSGACGLIAARDALGLDTRIIGVVSTQARAAQLSLAAGHPVHTDSARTFADGMAVRIAVAEAFEVYSRGLERIVAVSDDEVAAAMRLYFRSIHNVAEGAGAAPLAALMQEREQQRGGRAAVILCGGNVDSDVFAQVLAGRTPAA